MKYGDSMIHCLLRLTHSKPLDVKKVGPTPGFHRALEQRDTHKWILVHKTKVLYRSPGDRDGRDMQNAVEKGKLSYAEWFRVG